MYGKADEMPSFQLTMAVRANLVNLWEYIQLVPAFLLQMLN